MTQIHSRTANGIEPCTYIALCIGNEKARKHSCEY